MADREPLEAPVASWLQLESAVERLHTAAREGLDSRQFYRRLLSEVGSALGALGGAAWRPGPHGLPELICQSLDAEAAAELMSLAERRELNSRALAAGESAVRTSATDDCDALIVAVPNPGADEMSGTRKPTAATCEFWFPAGSSPLVQQGWIEFAATIAEIAADFQALEELRRLREGASLQRQSVDFLRRIQAPRDLHGVAFEVANEARRLLGCDRVSVLLRRGGRWRLLSTSGVSRIERRTDFTRRTERLADQVARWGEPLSYPAAASADDTWPPSVLSAVEEHVDHSHARELASVPIAFPSRHISQTEQDSPRGKRRNQFDAVLVAERFDADGASAWRHQLVELGELCGPALARAAALDRFPLGWLVRIADRVAVAFQPWRLIRNLAFVAAIAAAVAALVYVPTEFNVEAPATVKALVERDVFATATGTVAEIRVSHGQNVAKGDVLAVLNDPELALKRQQTDGEIDTVRKRLDALAVTRTDRTLRETKEGDDRLPLAAEQRQLEERLASLEAQRQLLETRRDALTLRSPLTGQVLTRDIDGLLASRPVQRGQALLTVADASSGWELVADVPQRQVGHVLLAQQQQSTPLGANLRLAGEVQETHPGHVVEISAAAPLEADGLENETPPVKVRIALDGDAPPAVRSGMTAAVRINCGQRSLGYVWLHDVGATIYRWVTF